MAQPDFVSPGAAPQSRLGRFVLGRELGRGATGVVYAATDTQQGRAVALKALTLPPYLTPDQRRDLAERFAHEARATFRLSHPAIVAVTEFGQADDGRQFLVMEQLQGETLRARLQRGGPLLASEALPLLTQIADALQYAHGRGIVHRDVKPDNIFLCTDGKAKLMDFGVAGVYAEDRPAYAGMIVGSPAYMSPEQIGGEALDGRSDVFSLAVTLAETLTGRRPFEGADIPTVMHQVLHQPPQLDGIGSRPLRRALERALVKNPDARTPSAGALAGALRQVTPPHVALGLSLSEASTLTTVVMPRSALRTSNPSRESGRWYLVGGGIAAALVLASLFFLVLPAALRRQASAPTVRASQGAASRIASARRVPNDEFGQRPSAVTAPDTGDLSITETTTSPPRPKPARPDKAILQALRDETVLPDAMPPAVSDGAAPITGEASGAGHPRPGDRHRAGRGPGKAAPSPSSELTETVPPDAVLYGIDNADHLQAPHLIHHTDPIYPPSAHSAAGTARLIVSVNPDGDVSDARVVQSSGDQNLDDAAIATVLRWEYAPATHDGRAVSANVAETVTFGPH